MKNRHSPHLFPICNGAPVQMPLISWMPAYVPQAEEVEQEVLAQPSHPEPPIDLFGFVGLQQELEKYLDDIADRKDWARGAW